MCEISLQLNKLISPKDDITGELKTAKKDSKKKVEETEHEDELAQALAEAGQFISCEILQKKTCRMNICFAAMLIQHV